MCKKHQTPSWNSDLWGSHFISVPPPTDNQKTTISESFRIHISNFMPISLTQEMVLYPVMDYQKLFTDLLHTPEGFITFVFIIITGVVTAIAGNVTPFLFKLAVKTLKSLPRLSRRGLAMLSNFRYWRKYHPIYEVDTGNIQCKRADGSYKLTIHIVMSITNKDDLETILLCFEKAVIVKTELHNIFDRKMSCCFRWAEGKRFLWLEPTEHVDGIQFAINSWVSTSPKMNEKVLCKFEQLATVNMKGARPLKWKPLHLKVVSDEEANNATS